MNILIRADSSSQIGLGHIMRDLVLAQQYPNDTITFACLDLAGNMMDNISYRVHILHSNDPLELITLIQNQKIHSFNLFWIKLKYLLQFFKNLCCMWGQCIDLPLHAVPWLEGSSQSTNYGQLAVYYFYVDVYGF